MDASRKAALVGMQLRGSAQELFRTIPPAALINGGFVNGAQVDPLTFLLHALSERFAALGDEVRLGAITDLLCFGRRSSHETVDDLLARFDILRQRAYDQGQLTMSITGLVWLLFRAVGVNDTQLIQLLQPFQGRVPQTEAELQALRVQLRRMGHVLEHAPGNIASSLRDNSARGQRAFLLNSEADANEGQGQDPWSEPDGYGWAGAAMPVDEQDNDSDAGTDTDTASSNGLPPPQSPCRKVKRISLSSCSGRINTQSRSGVDTCISPRELYDVSLVASFVQKAKARAKAKASRARAARAVQTWAPSSPRLRSMKWRRCSKTSGKVKASAALARAKDAKRTPSARMGSACAVSNAEANNTSAAHVHNEAVHRLTAAVSPPTSGCSSLTAYSRRHSRCAMKGR